MSNNTIYLHTVIRNALWQEIAAAIKKRDATVNKEELTAIHASAACFFVDRFKALTTENGDVWARMLEGAIHHLLCVAMLKSPAGKAGGGVLTSVEDLGNADLDPASIVRFCFKELAEPHLCDSKHYASRYMGLFETKAEILMRFVQEGYVGRTGAPAQMLPPDQRVDLKIEIGISWLHSGRLQPAMDALFSAREDSRHALKVSTAKLAKAWTNPGASAAYTRQWRQRAQALSALALAQLRHGRGAEIVCETLDDDLAHAGEIAARVTGERLVHESHKGLANGARRIIGRRAHIDLARGGLARALDGFRVATRLQKAAGYECLDGELARRYIETLVRSRSGKDAHLDEANEIVERNLRRHARGERSRRRSESNEIIALYTTQAMLKRVSGRFDESADILATAAQHPFVASGECPYIARKELEIEQARLKVMAVTNSTRSALVEELLALEMELTNTRHAQLSRQVMLMRAEILSDPAERDALVEVVQVQATTAGWWLRLKDVEVIRNGESALHVLGC